MPYADPEDRRAYKRRYYAENAKQRKLRAAACRRWRARFATAYRERVYGPDWTCHYCGWTTPPEDRGPAHGLTVDHRLPVCRGGDDSPENTLVACVSCNSRKGRKTYEEYVYGVLNWPRDAVVKRAFEEWDAVLAEGR